MLSQRIEQLVLAILVVGAAVGSCSQEWTSYKAKHGKSYEGQLEDSMRQAIFMRNKLRVEEFNARQSERAGYRLAVNRFSDWTETELRWKLTARSQGDRPRTRNTREGEEFLAKILGNTSDPVPDSVDWRKVPGIVSSVKDEQLCGSGWAFSTTDLLEGQQLKVTKGKELVDLSQQQLVDCNKEDGCYDFNWPTDALISISNMGGIESAQTYPYVSYNTGNCSFEKSRSIMSTKGPVVLPVDEEILKRVVAKYGPVVVTFNVLDASEIIQYSDGVYKRSKCPSNLHAGYGLCFVSVVGYGTDPEEGDYWLLKNSWTNTWGEWGYMRFARNMNNMCGIVSEAVIAAF